MADIFNRTTDVYGGSFSADQARLTFPALISGLGSESGLLVQQMQVNYQQQVTRLYEVGSPRIYYVGGRTQGSAGLGRVVGPKKIAREFYRTYGDVCRARTNTLQFSVETGCDAEAAADSRVSIVCHFVVITGVGFNVGAADMLINEQLQMMFSSMLYT